MPGLTFYYKDRGPSLDYSLLHTSVHIGTKVCVRLDVYLQHICGLFFKIVTRTSQPLLFYAGHITAEELQVSALYMWLLCLT